jgi:hypothetical protein
MGVCSSYAEIVKYEESVATMQPPSVGADAYLQFVWDNFDLNVSTLDGKDTIHYLAGMAVVSPGKEMKTDYSVLRKFKVPTVLDQSDLNLINIRNKV